jgi:hypothetical protein
LDKGVIRLVCSGVSYIAMLSNEKYVKKRHYDLKDLLRLNDVIKK